MDLPPWCENLTPEDRRVYVDGIGIHARTHNLTETVWMATPLAAISAIALAGALIFGLGAYWTIMAGAACAFGVGVYFTAMVQLETHTDRLRQMTELRGKGWAGR